MFWDGSRWMREEVTSASRGRPSPIVAWATTAIMVIGLAATALPLRLAEARSTPTISVWWTDASSAVASSPAGDSHFTAGGCGFRANDGNYYLVVYGPAPDTASLAYWVDPFPVDRSGCGSATPLWTSSG